jgi:hypothetical protein
MASEVLLFLADRFAWFGLTRGSGWNVFLSVALVGLAVLIGLLWLGLALSLRRRFQFSMRSLFVLMISVAISCSWFAVKMQQARRQREAVVAIRGLNGIVFYDHEFKAYSRGIQRAPSSARRRLQDLLGEDFCSNVEAVDLGRIRIWKKRIGNDPRLIIDGNVIVPKMHKTPLTHTEVTDLILPYLGDLKYLKTLDLGGSRVTDAGVVHLEVLANLDKLNLHGTNVTDEGVEKLQQALPNCRIQH